MVTIKFLLSQININKNENNDKVGDGKRFFALLGAIIIAISTALNVVGSVASIGMSI